MKNLLLPAFLVLLFSCSKINESPIDKINSVNFEKVEMVESELEQQKQLDMYLSLNSEERLKIWNNRISSFMESGKLSSQQKEILKIVSSKLTNSIFDLDQSALAKAREIETEITPLVLKSFSKGEMKEILASLKPIGKNYKSGLKPNSVQTACQCNGSSVWDCDRCTGGCSQDAHGCGTFLLFSCNYLCAGIAPNQQ